MKRTLVYALAFVSLVSCNRYHANEAFPHPHLPPDATAQDIQDAMSSDPVIATSPETQAAAEELKDITTMGARLYQWIDLVNSKRENAQKFSLTTKDGGRNYPIEKPSIYNVEIVRAEQAELLKVLPPAIKNVLESTDPLPAALPLSDEEFREWGIKVSRTYDTATRWIMMANYREYLLFSQRRDVRGIYYFDAMKDAAGTIAKFATLEKGEQDKIRTSLIQLCMNNLEFGERSDCVKGVAEAERKGELLEIYEGSVDESRALVQSYYDLDSSLIREDLVWSAQEPGVLHYPFLKPLDIKIANYLKGNVEDEFKTANWNLRIDFTDTDKENLSRLEFQSGVTPHAMKGKIVMDKNEPITEESSKWVIRHEFGHLLGFPDCYVEFFDEDLKAIVNYQLDVTDLMCSRTGKFKPHHFDRLKTQYYK